MPEYLVGIMYHEPEPYRLWRQGVIEDYESSTGLYIEADTPDEAIRWGEQVGEALLRHANSDPTLDWKGFGYFCWLEDSAEDASWQEIREFFPRVRAGEWPAFERITTGAYTRWLQQRRAESDARP